MLRYYPVPPFARGLCGLAYTLSSGDAPITVPLPALTAQVQVTLAGSVRHDNACGAAACDPQVALLGPTSAAAVARLAPGTTILGLGLLPAGWISMVRAPADELADRMVAGDAVWGTAAAAALLEEMAGAMDLEGAALALFRFVSGIGAADKIADPRIAITTDWLSAAGTLSVKDLANALDLSSRQTERFTARVFGERPKLLEMKYRVLRLAASSAISGTKVYEGEHGSLVDSFYDQSHLIRNFKRFLGHTPRTFDEHAPFARDMMRGRWRKGARSPMMLWS